ncbi:MAG: hypothetical protein LBQ32_09585 [Burkholderiaceae bacterium]|jgi:hypothetical protein|nr:hypothetical protein [Burkholderiaceae bacterium]
MNFKIALIATVLAIGGMGTAHADTDMVSSAAEQKTEGTASQTDHDKNQAPHRDRQWRATIFGGTWMDTTLPAFPKNLLTGNIKLQNAHFLGGGLSRVLVPRFDIPFFSTTLPGNSMELEGQIVKHFGKQDHVELTGAIVVRSGEIHPLEQLSFNVAWANGFSYALSNPAYEKGPEGIPGVNSRKFQYYMGIETEFTHQSMPNTHLMIKLHHRSGIYGVISQRKTGSNYIVIGLGWDI